MFFPQILFTFILHMLFHMLQQSAVEHLYFPRSPRGAGGRDRATMFAVVLTHPTHPCFTIEPIPEPVDCRDEWHSPLKRTPARVIVLSIITYIEEWIDIFDIFHLNFYLVGILTIIMIVHAVVHNGIRPYTFCNPSVAFGLQHFYMVVVRFVWSTVFLFGVLSCHLSLFSASWLLHSGKSGLFVFYR